MTVNWLMGLKLVMTRTTVSGICYNKGNGCTIEDGSRMYTINGAYQNHRVVYRKGDIFNTRKRYLKKRGICFILEQAPLLHMYEPHLSNQKLNIILF